MLGRFSLLRACDLANSSQVTSWVYTAGLLVWLTGRRLPRHSTSSLAKIGCTRLMNSDLPLLGAPVIQQTFRLLSPPRRRSSRNTERSHLPWPAALRTLQQLAAEISTA